MRYASLRLIEIDEEWQTGRRYMKMGREDQFPHEDDPLLCEIKEGVKAQEELVVL